MMPTPWRKEPAFGSPVGRRRTANQHGPTTRRQARQRLMHGYCLISLPSDGAMDGEFDVVRSVDRLTETGTEFGCGRVCIRTIT